MNYPGLVSARLNLHFLNGLTVFLGRGGASIYGKQFEDELHPELKFTGTLCS